MTEEVVFKTKYITDALRHQGYNAYNAIEDIVDNSLEGDVGASKVNVEIQREDDSYLKVNKISISDDGCGMTVDVLREAMAFGSDTGKSRKNSLGSYGAGLKTSSLSIAQTFEVHTKREDEDVIHVVKFDITEDAIIKNGGKVCAEYDDVPYVDGPVKKYFDEKTWGAGHGTVVVLYNIDRGIPSSYYSFRNILTAHLRRTYTFFLNKQYAGLDLSDVIKNDVQICVNGAPITYFDIIGIDADLGVEKIHEEEFDLRGSHFKYIDYYMPSSPSAMSDGENYYGRGIEHAAINVARNGRFTSLSTRFGIYFDQHAAGYKAILLVDGESDALLGATYRKTTNDCTAASMDPELADILLEIIKKGKNDAINRQKADHDTDPTSIDALDNINKVLKDMDKNPLLKKDEGIKDIMAAARKLRKETRKNQKQEEKAPEEPKESNTEADEVKDPKENKETGEMDPQSKKERLVRSYKNIIDFILENNGPRENLYTISKNDITGKIEIYINVDHVYFDDVLGKENSDAAYYGWCNIIINAISLERIGYFVDETKRSALDEFLSASSAYLDSSVNGNRPEEQRV